MRKRRKAKKKLPFRAFIITAMFLIVLLAVGVVAKYVHNASQSGYLRTENFYFSSNLLTEDGNAVYDLNAGTTSLSIILKNQEDELRISEVDIPYTISVTNVTGGTVTLSSASGELSKDSADSDTITVTIPSGVTGFKLTATTNTTYEKTLSATFNVLQEGADFGFSSEEYDGYVELTVWSNGYEGDLAVTVPAGLIPDRTDPRLSSMTYNNSGTNSFSITDIAANESVTYRFFISSGYSTGDDFAVSKS